MSKIGKDLIKLEAPKIKYRKYSDPELKDFHEKVQKYYFDYTLQNGEVIRVIDKQKLMIDFGAITSEEAVVVDEVSLPPNRLQQFENVYDQWQYWKVRTGLDKGRINTEKLKQLDKMANEMTVEPVGDQIPF